MRAPQHEPKNILRMNAGAVASRVNRMTRTTITLYNSVEAGLENDPEGKWSTVCENHGAIVSHATRAYAASAMSCPDWCDDCREAMDQREGA
jgi:hypothetical protein